MTEYKRLRGAGRGPFQFSRLWLGPDHLLLVASTGFVEEYRRFYFADMQAFYIRRTNEGRRWNIAWGFAAGVAALIAFQLSGLGAALVWSLVLLSLTAVAVNTLRGPTCLCHLKTPALLHRLPPLTRLASDRRLLHLIGPAIAQAQGGLRPEESMQLEQLVGGQVPPRQVGDFGAIG